MEHDELLDLAARARAGDTAARNRVAEAHMHLATAVVRAMGRRPAQRWAALDEDDLIQIGLARLVECIPGWSPHRGDFEGYACRSIRNALCRALGRRRVMAIATDPTGFAVSAWESERARDRRESDGGHDRFDAGHDAAYVLDRLPPRYADLLRLRYGVGRDGEVGCGEAAALLGISGPVAIGRTARALRMARSLIEGRLVRKPRFRRRVDAGRSAPGRAILAALADGPLHRRDIAGRTGIDLRVVAVTLTGLRGANKVRRVSVGIWAAVEPAA